MSEPIQSEKTFQIIMKRLMATGQAPHFTEIAAELEVSVEEGRKALHALFCTRLSGLVVSEYRLYLLVPTIQQPPHPIPHHDRWPTEVVRPVRI